MSDIYAAAHGLSAGDQIMFGNLVGGEGLVENSVYYVASTGLAADSFRVTLNSDATGEVTFTTDITDGVIVRPDTYAVVADGVMDPPPALSTPSPVTLATSIVSTVVRLSITVPAYADAAVRIRQTEVQVTHAYSAGSPDWTKATVVTTTPDTPTVTFPALGDTLYAARSRVQDTFGNLSGWSDVVEETTTAGPDSLVVPDGSITTAKLLAGQITLYDENSRSVLTPAGFEGPWAHFIRNNLYNSDLISGLMMGTIDISNQTVDAAAGNSMPYWGWTTHVNHTVLVQSSFFAISGGGTTPAASKSYFHSMPVAVRPGSRFHIAIGTTESGGGGQWTAYPSISYYGMDSEGNLDPTALTTVAADSIVLDTATSKTYFSAPLTVPSTARFAVATVGIALTTASFLGPWLELTHVGLIEGVPPAIASTYQPTIGNSGTATFSANSATYHRAGKIVFWTWEMTINSAGSAGGAITVSLPSTPQGNPIITGYSNGFTTFANGPVSGLLQSANGAVVTAIRDQANVTLNRSHFAGGAYLRLTGFYFEA